MGATPNYAAMIQEGYGMSVISVLDIDKVKSLNDIKVGDIFYTSSRGEGRIISKTKRTLTARFDKSTCKITYNSSKCEYPLKEF